MPVLERFTHTRKNNMICISMYCGRTNLLLRLYVARHGETMWNIENKLQGWSDSALTNNGVRNAKLLGERLKNVHFQSVYSSSSERALTTTNIVFENRNESIIPLDDLREIQLGNWEGQTFAQLERQYPQQFPAFIQRSANYSPEQGESFAEVQTRIKNVVDRIIAENESGNIFIMTHSVCIEVLLAYYQNISLDQLGTLPTIHGTSVTIIDVNENQFDIKVIGDISHYEHVTNKR